MKDPSLSTTRRNFVLGGAASLGLLAWPRLGLTAVRSGPTGEAATDDTVLVLVELAGGNDGICTIVPHADDAYHRNRVTTLIPTKELIPLDDYRGFHPSLKNLHRVWERGELAIVEGVGYPNPNRSHFMSQEIWGTANEKGKVSGDGWIGKLLSARFGEERLPTRAVHFGGKLPDPLLSTHHPVLCMESPTSYRWARDQSQIAAAADAAGSVSANDIRSRLRAVLDDAGQSSALVRDAVARYRPGVAYPKSALGEALLTAAALIDGRVGTRILSVTLSGFDTHANQKDDHASLWDNVDQSVGAFLDDIGRSSAGARVVTMLFSEFGRRVAENGSRGTDHGAAAPLFLAGPRVHGGLHGTHPSLTELDDGDLIHSVDFRRIYATLIRDCFDVDPRAVIGGDWQTMPLLKA